MSSENNLGYLSSFPSVLVKNLKQRDRSAFEQLYDEYSSPLYSLILSILPDSQAANILLEKVFKIVWVRIEDFDFEHASLFTWLYSITRKEAILEKRQQELSNAVRPGEPLVFKNIMQFRELINELPEPSRTVILLSYFENANDEEIATLLHSDAVFVKNSKNKGLNIISKLIAGPK